MARSSLLSVCIVALVCLVGLRQAFVPAPQVESPLLRGSAAVAGAVAAAAPLAAFAEPDEYIDYNFSGEITPYMVGGYFALTTAMTLFAFASYLVLAKLKII